MTLKSILILLHVVLTFFFGIIVNAQSIKVAKYQRTEKEARTIVENIIKTYPVIDGHNDLFAWYFGCDYKKLPKCPQDISDYPLDTIQKVESIQEST